MRPGRLDRILYVGPPDASGREEIIRIKLGRMSVAPDVDVRELARLVRTVSMKDAFLSQV
jgi:AAA family ATPase